MELLRTAVDLGISLDSEQALKLERRLRHKGTPTDSQIEALTTVRRILEVVDRTEVGEPVRLTRFRVREREHLVRLVRGERCYRGPLQSRFGQVPPRVPRRDRPVARPRVMARRHRALEIVSPRISSHCHS